MSCICSVLKKQPPVKLLINRRYNNIETIMTFCVVCQEGPFIFFFLRPSHQEKDIKIWGISRMGYYFKEFCVSKGSGFIFGCYFFPQTYSN